MRQRRCERGGGGAEAIGAAGILPFFCGLLRFAVQPDGGTGAPPRGSLRSLGSVTPQVSLIRDTAHPVGTMEKMARTHVAIIGAPLDLGQDRRGVDMGPSAVRVANLHARVASLGYEVEDWGNIPVEQKEAWPEGDAHAKYLALIASTCKALATRVDEALAGGLLPLVLGGDHS